MEYSNYTIGETNKLEKTLVTNKKMPLNLLWVWERVEYLNLNYLSFNQ